MGPVASVGGRDASRLSTGSTNRYPRVGTVAIARGPSPSSPKAFRRAETRRREVAFFDDRVGPERGHERLLLDETTRSIDEVQKEIERFGGQRDRMTVTKQETFGGIQPKGAKLTDRQRATR